MEGETGHGVLFRVGAGAPAQRPRGRSAGAAGGEQWGVGWEVVWRGKGSWVRAGGSGISHSSEKLEIWEGVGGVERSRQM